MSVFWHVRQRIATRPFNCIGKMASVDAEEVVVANFDLLGPDFDLDNIQLNEELNPEDVEKLENAMEALNTANRKKKMKILKRSNSRPGWTAMLQLQTKIWMNTSSKPGEKPHYSKLSGLLKYSKVLLYKH